MIKIDEGHKSLSALILTYGKLRLSNANEAETRLKVVDAILVDILGWSKDDISVEVRVSEDGKTEFADYVIRTAAVSLLVEAKRAAAGFTLPSGRTRLKLGGVLSTGQVGAAIRQARDYCRKRSIPFACVTNGASWVVFPAVRTDSVPFEDSEAWVFRDFEDINSRFVEFWELLSRERTLDGNLEHVMLGRGGRELPGPTLRELLPEPGYRLGRNALYSHIEPALAAALSDESLLNDSDALAACYVKTSERLKYDARLSMHLRDELPPLGHPTTRVKTNKNSARLDYQLKTAEIRSPLRFIVVLGPVGAGKSTFLHYTRRVSAAELLNHKVVWLHVDFKKATREDSPRVFLLQQILSIIEEDDEFNLGSWDESIRHAYAPQIQAIKKGPGFLLAKNDVAQFEKKISEYVGEQRAALQPYVETIVRWAGSKWPVFLVVDNVDQLEDLDLQEQIFAEAHAFARRVECNVIMSLRESTYLRHRERPAFDAFQFESFYIDPPNVLPVLSHRFGYAKRVLGGKSVKLMTEHGMNVNVPDLGKFFDLVSYSLLSGDTGFMIECLAGGNIRRGLNIVREFLASGHTNADRAIAAYVADGEYRFPKHEVFRGAVLGPFKYYNDVSSILPNLFDSKLGSVGLQLARFRIVSYLVSRSSKGVTDGVAVAELSSVLSRLGVSESDALTVLAHLAARYLIQGTDGLPVHGGSKLVATRLGGYALHVLCADFAYMEFCCVDSVIFDNETLEELKELTFEAESVHDMVQRLQIRRRRMDIYLDYLDRNEKRWIVEAKRKDLAQEWQELIIANIVKPKVGQSSEVAVKSALRMNARMNGRPVGGSVNRAKVVNDEFIYGTIVSCWLDRESHEYLFIRDDDGVEWYAHRAEFASASDWEQRARGMRCQFKRGEWNGKKRAVAIRVNDDGKDSNAHRNKRREDWSRR